MNFTSHFGPGDKAWIFGDGPEQVTIGQIRLTLTSSKGIPGETMFSNYKPQKGFVEEYMCVETGIGSGSIYTYGRSIFTTKQECLDANASRIKQMQKAAEEMRKLDIERAKSQMLDAAEQLRQLGIPPEQVKKEA